jgi:hypothetical protein
MFPDHHRRPELDKDEIDTALHEIGMMVTVLLGAAEYLHASEATHDVFEIPHDWAELLSFSAYDVHKRVKELKAAVLA